VIGAVIGVVVLVILAVLVVVSVASAKSYGVERIARCRAGHLFTSTVIPGASIKAVRLGNVRFQRCPVGHHWSLVSWVDPSTLTPEELATARSRHDIRLP
jgi:hypothetical protein